MMLLLKLLPQTYLRPLHLLPNRDLNDSVGSFSKAIMSNCSMNSAIAQETLVTTTNMLIYPMHGDGQVVARNSESFRHSSSRLTWDRIIHAHLVKHNEQVICWHPFEAWYIRTSKWMARVSKLHDHRDGPLQLFIGRSIVTCPIKPVFL